MALSSAASWFFEESQLMKPTTFQNVLNLKITRESHRSKSYSNKQLQQRHYNDVPLMCWCLFFRVEPFFCLNFKVKKMLQVEIHMSNFTKMSALEKRTKICSTTFQTNGAKIHLKVQCFALKMLLVCILSPCQNATNLSLPLSLSWLHSKEEILLFSMHIYTCTPANIINDMTKKSDFKWDK